MKNYFLGFFPDQKSNHQIRKVVGEVGRVFDGQDLRVRWANPDHFHVSLVFLGSNLNPIQKFLLNSKLKALIIPKFNISFEKCELGISRQYKELVYLTTKEGGEQLRNLVYSLRNKLKISDYSNYIPHLTLGRVSKDISNEEHKNISADLRNINKKLDLGSINFTSENLCYIESDLTNYKVLRNFSVA